MKRKIPFMFGGLGGYSFDYVTVNENAWVNADESARKELFLNGEWGCYCEPEQEWTIDLKQRITE